jgi:hypothetical protein
VAAVLAAEALAHPAPARAADGDAVVLGQVNNETTVTTIKNSSSSNGALFCSSDAGFGASGFSSTGTAIIGNTDTGVAGRFASGFGGNGVIGETRGGIGVTGFSVDNEGIRGQAGLTASSVTSSHTGVHGITNSDAAGAVWGENLAGGDGVRGSASTGNAIIGVASGSGSGVVGGSAGGTGVLAVGSKTALQVQGPAAFSRSGILTIKAGQSTAKKSGIALTAASFVLATIQGNVAGVFVQGVTLVTGSPGSFTVHLNKTVSKNLKVAWFAIN